MPLWAFGGQGERWGVCYMAPSRLVHEMFFMVLSSVPLERCACYVLCVACCVLRVTCDVLRVTCYVSHVTCGIIGSQLGGAAL